MAEFKESPAGNIRISIVIATYNAAKSLSGTLDSIINQRYPTAEIVIVDGNSTDNTLDIIKAYDQHISFWLSERDHGIYDAWNKGVKQSHGDWIMFLGSDDSLVSGALQAYSDFINNLDQEVDFVSSKANYTDKDLVPYRIIGWPWEWPRFRHVNTVAHPGSLHSRRLFQKYGYFDTYYKLSGDYEFLLRSRSMLKAVFMDKITVFVREGGGSDSYASISESFRASVRTGKAPLVPSLWHSGIAYLKFFGRKFLRQFNIKVYLKRQLP